MNREEFLISANAITEENDDINEGIADILSSLEGSSYNSAEASMAASLVQDIDWNKREEKFSALNAWYRGYIAENKDDFDVFDARQMMEFSMPDRIYAEDVIKRWKAK